MFPWAKSGAVRGRSPKGVHKRLSFILLVSFVFASLSPPAYAGRWEEYNSELQIVLSKTGAIQNWGGDTGIILGFISGVVATVSGVATAFSSGQNRRNALKFFVPSSLFTALMAYLGIAKPIEANENAVKISTLLGTDTFKKIAQQYGPEVAESVAMVVLTGHYSKLSQNLDPLCETSEQKALCSTVWIKNVLTTNPPVAHSNDPAVNTQIQDKPILPLGALSRTPAMAAAELGVQAPSALSGKEGTYNEEDDFNIYGGHGGH